MRRTVFFELMFIPVLAISISCEDLDDDFGDNFNEDILDERVSIDDPVYQAENRTAASGCQIAKNHAGFTGSGFIDFGGNGTWIEWNQVEAPLEGEYRLSFRYAVGTSTRPSTVSVNGKNVGAVGFANTGSWEKWRTDSIDVQLRQGKNSVRVRANTGSGGPNLDKMELSISDLCPDDPQKTEPGQCGCGVKEGECEVDLPYKQSFGSPGGSFKCRKKTCLWSSRKINTSAAGKLKITADARSFVLGQFESADYLKMSYRIDGGAWKTFFRHTDDLKARRVTHSFSNSGSTLEVRLEAKTSARNETYEVDDLTVEKDGDDPVDDCRESDGCYEIVSSGTSDHTARIQDALDQLNDGDTLRLKGDFVFRRTLYLPSNVVWILKGSLTLGDNSAVNLDRVGVVDRDRDIDSRKATAITEKPGGATHIDMSGGTYYGNARNNDARGVRLINFIQVTDSKFHDMIIENASDDNFTIGAKSRRNEMRNLTSRAAGAHSGMTGNGLTDKGDYNKWYDCIAEDCLSDGWTPKCRNSEFHRCIGRRNKGPGFGLYARLDGSSQDDNRGESIDGNKFYACEAYENYRGGISFNISANCNNGATIRNNFIQGAFYNNRMDGVLFRNKTEDGVVANNELDILVFGNKGLKFDGSPSSIGGGLSIDGHPITGLTGAVVAYENGGNDIHLGKGTESSITAYSPNDRDPADVSKGDSSNDVDEVRYSCSQSRDYWSMQAYCSNKYDR